MKAIFSQGSVTFVREATDPRFHGIQHARGECRLFHYIAKWLNVRGFDIIKKRAQDDMHMIGDEYQPYLRCRKPLKNIPHIYIWSGFYALRGANADWNRGEVSLLLETNVFDKGQDTMAMIRTLCEDDPNMDVK
jgi:hypothetical protein